MTTLTGPRAAAAGKGAAMAKQSTGKFTRENLAAAKREGFRKSAKFPSKPADNAPVKSWDAFRAKLVKLKGEVSAFLREKKAKAKKVAATKRIAGL